MNVWMLVVPGASRSIPSRYFCPVPCPDPLVPRSCPVPACRGSFASLSEKGSPPPAGILFVPAGDPCPHRPDSNHSRPATHPCEVSGPDWLSASRTCPVPVSGGWVTNSVGQLRSETKCPDPTHRTVSGHLAARLFLRKIARPSRGLPPRAVLAQDGPVHPTRRTSSRRWRVSTGAETTRKLLRRRRPDETIIAARSRLLRNRTGCRGPAGRWGRGGRSVSRVFRDSRRRNQEPRK
jgi:hypothetical protein